MNLYVFFTYNTSLYDWNKNGTLEREVSYYSKFIKEGIKVTFITYSDNDKKYLKKKFGIEVISIFKKKKSNYKVVNFIKSLLFIFYFCKYNKENIIIKSNQMKGAWLPLLISKIYKKKFILRCGYEYYRFSCYNDKNFIKKYILYITSYFSYKFSNRIVITNNFEKKYIINKFSINPKKIKVIPNYINTNIFKKKNIQKKFDILFVGRFESQKNLNLFVESIESLPLKILLIGNGKLINELKFDLKKRKIKYKMIKSVQNDKLPLYLNQSKIFLTTTLYEGNPKSILEAQSSETIVISTKFEGSKDLIKDRFNGFLTSYNKKEITFRIKYCLKNLKKLKSLKINARKTIIQKNNINKIFSLELKELNK